MLWSDTYILEKFAPWLATDEELDAFYARLDEEKLSLNQASVGWSKDPEDLKRATAMRFLWQAKQEVYEGASEQWEIERVMVGQFRAWIEELKAARELGVDGGDGGGGGVTKLKQTVSCDQVIGGGKSSSWKQWSVNAQSDPQSPLSSRRVWSNSPARGKKWWNGGTNGNTSSRTKTNSPRSWNWKDWKSAKSKTDNNNKNKDKKSQLQSKESQILSQEDTDIYNSKKCQNFILEKLLDEGVEVVKTCLSSREEWEINETLSDIDFQRLEEDGPVTKFREAFGFSFAGKALRDYPMLIMRPGKADLEKLQTMMEENEKDLLRNYFRVMEYFSKVEAVQMSKRTGKICDRLVIVLDFDGFSYAAYNFFKELTEKVAPIIRLVYPETLAHVLIINLPWIIQAPWSTIMPLILSESTVRKVQLLPSYNVSEEWKDIIDENNIPWFLGGKMDHFYVQPNKETERLDGGSEKQWTQQHVKDKKAQTELKQWKSSWELRQWKKAWYSKEGIGNSSASVGDDHDHDDGGTSQVNQTGWNRQSQASSQASWQSQCESLVGFRKKKSWQLLEYSKTWFQEALWQSRRSHVSISSVSSLGWSSAGGGGGGSRESVNGEGEDVIGGNSLGEEATSSVGGGANEKQQQSAKQSKDDADVVEKDIIGNNKNKDNDKSKTTDTKSKTKAQESINDDDDDIFGTGTSGTDEDKEKAAAERKAKITAKSKTIMAELFG